MMNGNIKSMAVNDRVLIMYEEIPSIDQRIEMVKNMPKLKEED